MVAFVKMSCVKAFAASILAGLEANTTLATSTTKFLNASLLETKSVSELISKINASLPLTTTCVKPSAAIREAFFATFAIPFSLNHSTAFSTSQSVSINAFLQQPLLQFSYLLLLPQKPSLSQFS